METTYRGCSQVVHQPAVWRRKEPSTAGRAVALLKEGTEFDTNGVWLSHYPMCLGLCFLSVINGFFFVFLASLSWGIQGRNVPRKGFGSLRRTVI